MSWPSKQNAIHAAIVACLPNSIPVRWAYQDGKRPTTSTSPYEVLIHQGASEGLGSTANISVTDTVSPTSGTEVTTTVRQQYRVTFTVDVFSKDSEAGGNSAKLWAETIRLKLQLPKRIYALDLEGVALLSISEARPLPAILETRYESRCQVDLVIGLTEEVSDTDTYIETVNTTETVA